MADSAAEGADSEVHRELLRLSAIRLLSLLVVGLGLWYVSWRWTTTLNMRAWWISIPLAAAESYALIDGILFGITMWRSRRRPLPPPPDESWTVDVFITTYNEPLDLVMRTAEAARAISWPHQTYVLDDGDREEFRVATGAAGIGYINRSADWEDRPRHAKAGNLNNALFQTTGEFLLILDADQIPEPEIIERTLGYFHDPKVALVQTPQFFTNVPESDPLGSQAPLFYGPIQQGKDGWNAAFFCGSNAMLRREALMQLGVVGYVRSLEATFRRTLSVAERVVTKARREARGNASVLASLDSVRVAALEATNALGAGEPISEVASEFQRRVDEASRAAVAADLASLRADLLELGEMPLEIDDELGLPVVDDGALDRLAERDLSPIGAFGSIRELVSRLDVDRSDEAQPVMPIATISVTEDMATAMRLHSLGWRSVYHHELLANGLAPEDVGTMIQQRLRWAQGSLQVLLRENPLRVRGLSIGQRLMYLATMWSYLSGFAAVVFILSPMLYLLAGVRPVHSFGGPFLWHLLPYFIANQLLFLVVGYGVKTWRGQQYSLALFPLWIRACVTAVANVLAGRKLGFVVTPKEKVASDWRHNVGVVRVQFITMGLLVISVVVGIIRLALGIAPSEEGTVLNVVWVAYDLLAMSVLIEAVRYRGYEEREEIVP